jgi:hypothetical protein
MSHYAANTKVSPEASQADINLALDGGGIRPSDARAPVQLLRSPADSRVRDDKFLQPQHLVYDDDIRSWYSVKDIVEVMNQQHLGDVDENGSPLLYGIDCELPKHTFGPLHSATYDEFVEITEAHSVLQREYAPEGDAARL